jgi:hypothetical protein
MSAAMVMACRLALVWIEAESQPEIQRERVRASVIDELERGTHVLPPESNAQSHGTDVRERAFQDR